MTGKDGRAAAIPDPRPDPRTEPRPDLYAVAGRPEREAEPRAEPEPEAEPDLAPAEPGPAAVDRDPAEIAALHAAALVQRRARRQARRAEAHAVAAARKAEREAAPAPAPAVAPAPEVGTARLRARHYGVIASFLLLVLVPLAACVTYLYTRAADQYHSNVAFSIRSEEMGSAAAGLLGAITQIGGGTASDTDILFEFIRSQKIVEEIDADLDLRALYNAAEGDPVFTLGEEDASIEALHAQWNRMVDVSFEGTAGIIQVRANAFDPEAAQAIARAILAHSSALVNRLSEQARGDAIRFARDELAEAEAALRAVRQRLADFRRANRIVDPSADVAGQMGLLNALQTELAQALVDRDVLLSFADSTDQRVIQGDRRIEAITARIEEERNSLDADGAAGSLPDMVGAYEELLVDLEFANTAYTQALGGLAGARAEARRQSRYLAPHIQPTLAQSALYPRRALISGLIALFLVLGWGVLMLIYYNVRDNR